MEQPGQKLLTNIGKEWGANWVGTKKLAYCSCYNGVYSFF